MNCKGKDQFKQYDQKAVIKCKCGYYRLLGTICDREFLSEKIIYKL